MEKIRIIVTTFMALAGTTLAVPAVTGKGTQTPSGQKKNVPQNAPITVYTDKALQDAEKKTLQNAAQKYAKAKCVGGYQAFVSAESATQAQMNVIIQLAKLQMQKNLKLKINSTMGEISNGYWYYYNAANPGYLFSLSQLKNGKVYQYFCQLQK